MSIFKDLVLSKKTLTDKLLDEVSDYDIYCELTNCEFDVGRAVISPIRLDDDSPSFSLFIPTRTSSTIRPEELWWRDFRDGSGDVFKFTKLFAKIHYGLNLENRKEIIKFIDTQLELGLFGSEKKYIKKRHLNYEKLKESKEILFTSRDFTPADILWWTKIGVDLPLLRKYDIRSLKYLLRDDFTIIKKFSQYELGYAFVVYDKVKIYQPHSNRYKWTNTCPSDYVQGWQQLEHKDTLIITKSYKDALVFKSFMDVDVIAPQSESGSIPEAKLSYIKSQYKNVFVVFDYDPAGKIGANKLHDDHGFLVRWVSTAVDAELGRPIDKDISDYITNHGILSGLNKLKALFPELDDNYFKDDRVDYFTQLLSHLNNN